MASGLNRPVGEGGIEERPGWMPGCDDTIRLELWPEYGCWTDAEPHEWVLVLLEEWRSGRGARR